LGVLVFGFWWLIVGFLGVVIFSQAIFGGRGCEVGVVGFWFVGIWKYISGCIFPGVFVCWS
jgi:hypothetical protein